MMMVIRDNFVHNMVIEDGVVHNDGNPSRLGFARKVIQHDFIHNNCYSAMMVIPDYFLSQRWLSWRVTSFTRTVIPDDLMMIIQSAVVHNDGTMFDSCTPIPGKKLLPTRTWYK
jgi:hypothetical protein